jgi:myo-inositol-1-phosphate synthase
VGTCVALGLAALQKGLIDQTGLTTAQPPLSLLPLDQLNDIVIGGHEIRQGRFQDTVKEFQTRSGIFSHELVTACTPLLESMAKNIRPGSVINCGETIQKLTDWDSVPTTETPVDAIKRLKADIQAFQKEHKLTQVVVINVSSTEPPTPLGEVHDSLAKLKQAWINKSEPSPLPASSLYAWAAIEGGYPFVNFTPSLGASFPAFRELLVQHKGIIAGQDGKTGETLLKSAMAPMFLARNLKLLSWVGHNIFGNRDDRLEPYSLPGLPRREDGDAVYLAGVRFDPCWPTGHRPGSIGPLRPAARRDGRIGVPGSVLQRADGRGRP